MLAGAAVAATIVEGAVEALNVGTNLGNEIIAYELVSEGDPAAAARRHDINTLSDYIRSSYVYSKDGSVYEYNETLNKEADILDVVYATSIVVGVATTVSEGVWSALKKHKQKVAGKAGKSVSDFEKYFDKNAKNSLWTKADDVVDTAEKYGKESIVSGTKEALGKSATEGIEGGKNINYNVINTSSADDVNKIFRETMGYEPPYKPGTIVTDIELTENTTFIRVYDKINSRMQGGWVMKAEDIAGLTPQAIQNKFALPNTPKYICDVNLEAGIKLRSGEVNPLFGFDGGGQQFDLIINGKNVGTFINERMIGQ